MSDIHDAQAILTRVTNDLLTVGKERNYRSDTFWNAIYAITVAQNILIGVEYPR
jgi:hypothetical protein